MSILLAIGWAVWNQLTALPLVQFDTASLRPIQVDFTAEATVLGTQYQVASEANGHVTDLWVSEGSEVSKGQIIATIDDSQSDALASQALASYSASVAATGQAAAELRSIQIQQMQAVAAAQARVVQAKAGVARTKAPARPEELGQAQHRVDQAQAAMDLAEKSYKRAEFLYQEGAISGAQRDTALAAYKSATSDLASAQDAFELVRKGPRKEDVDLSLATLKAAEADSAGVEAGSTQIEVRRQALRAAQAVQMQASAALSQSRSRVRLQEVRAPEAGFVTNLAVERGQVVLLGQAIAFIASRNDLRIEAEFDTEDAAKIRVGAQVDVTSAAYPGRRFPAHISEIMAAGELKPGAAIRTRIIRARVMLDSDWSIFKPGMEVDVEGTAYLRKTLCVPSDAVVYDEGSAVVWVVSNGAVQRRQVKTGYVTAHLTEILQGLREGEKVATSGIQELRDGGRVEVTK